MIRGANYMVFLDPATNRVRAIRRQHGNASDLQLMSVGVTWWTNVAAGNQREAVSLGKAIMPMARREQAEQLARAIGSTIARARGGFMAHATMKNHVASLWGQVDYKGLRVDVEQILGVR